MYKLDILSYSNTYSYMGTSIVVVVLTFVWVVEGFKGDGQNNNKKTHTILVNYIRDEKIM